MAFPPDFTFSQQNLQDYLDCPRRFYLRYIEHLEWPAIESEPVLEQEKLMHLGHDFHVLVQQYLSGIPAEVIRESIQEEDLLRWWLNFESLDLNLTKNSSYVEEPLSIPMAGYRLMAKVDLLLLDNSSNGTIYDWKTSRSEPHRSSLANRAQTRVYPYVVTLCTQIFPGSSPIAPENLKMIYWYPEHPDLEITFEYSREKLESDEKYLTSLIQEITSLQGMEQFLKTMNEKKCDFCKFRSLCERGAKAGANSDEDASLANEDSFDIDFDSL